MCWKGMMMINVNQPFGLYLHIPFCTSKCSYCDFYSESVNGMVKEEFVSALKKEIKLYSDRIPRTELKTIYFGGGTPSLLTSGQVGELINLIREVFSYPETGEITLEANPASLTKNKITEYYSKGINRLSLGIQSFSDRDLDFLGRLHNSEMAETTIRQVRKVFNNFNLDLIFAIPGQELSDWMQTLEKTLVFAPPHLSLYNLQIESETPLGVMMTEGKIRPVCEELDAEMYLKAREVLFEAGYEQYEISNFALPGYSSRHNRIYWEYDPYLGLGPSAHSFSGEKRFYNYSDIDKYIEALHQGQLPVAEINFLSEAEQMSEMLFMGLRLTGGVSKQDFYRRFGKELETVYNSQIEDLTALDLLISDVDRIYLTEKGLLLANQVFMKFLI